MRLFVALEISTEVRERIGQMISQWKRLEPAPRWVSAENLHVTLTFIGEAQPSALPAIQEALAGIREQDPVDLEFCGAGFFPGTRRPAVLWIGVRSSPNLAPLAQRIDNALAAATGVAAETRAFLPHLTIARFKEPRLAPALSARLAAFGNKSLGSFSVRHFQLVESKLRPGGAEYTTVRSFPFVSGHPPQGNFS